jgi:hypothetical protein
MEKEYLRDRKASRRSREQAGKAGNKRLGIKLEHQESKQARLSSKKLKSEQSPNLRTSYREKTRSVLGV